MKKKSKSSVSNTKIAVIFFAFLAFFAGISLIFKTVTVIRQGQFDDSGRFTLSITNGKDIEVVSLSPNSKNIVVFKFNSLISPEEAGRLLKVPIDGFIASNSLDLNQKLSSLFLKAIPSYNKLKTNLTVIDLFRMAMLARTIPENSVNERVIEKDATELNPERVVGRLVTDTLIEKDRQTIQVINATEIGGLGNRLARLITNMGGNVIIVATSDSPRKKSNISYIDKKTYTVERLQKVLKYEVVREPENAISDITIIIGEDGLKLLPF